MSICFWCQEPDAPWYCPASSEPKVLATGQVLAIGSPGWHCCERCHELVERRDVKGLGEILASEYRRRKLAFFGPEGQIDLISREVAEYYLGNILGPAERRK